MASGVLKYVQMLGRQWAVGHRWSRMQNSGNNCRFITSQAVICGAMCDWFASGNLAFFQANPAVQGCRYSWMMGCQSPHHPDQWGGAKHHHQWACTLISFSMFFFIRMGRWDGKIHCCCHCQWWFHSVFMVMEFLSSGSTKVRLILHLLIWST